MSPYYNQLHRSRDGNEHIVCIQPVAYVIYIHIYTVVLYNIYIVDIEVDLQYHIRKPPLFPNHNSSLLGSLDAHIIP